MLHRSESCLTIKDRQLATHVLSKLNPLSSSREVGIKLGISKSYVERIEKIAITKVIKRMRNLIAL